MKKCPQCKSIYTDDTLAFCLSDGTPLDRARDSEETVQLPVMPTIPSQPAFPTVETSTNASNVSAHEEEEFIRPRGTVSRIWIFTTVALFSVLVGVLAFMFMFGGIGATVDGNQPFESGITTPPIPENKIRSEIPPDNSTRQPDVSPARTITPATLPDSPRLVTYRVTGVTTGDVLYIRPAPGNIKTFVGKIPPGAAGIIVTGSAVRVGKTSWLPIKYNGINGWVNKKFIAPE